MRSVSTEYWLVNQLTTSTIAFACAVPEPVRRFCTAGTMTSSSVPVHSSCSQATAGMSDATWTPSLLSPPAVPK